MLGIPEWAIGVGVVLTIVSVLRIVSARFLPPSEGRGRRRFLRGETAEELEEMQAKLAELDELKHRVGELEERVDFAERLLARKREEERLNP